MGNLTCKSILTKTKIPKAIYTCNPYIGCTHNCQYCYAEEMCRYRLEDREWGKFVDRKENALEVLQKEVKKIKAQEEVFMASITDVYQPIESVAKVTRGMLSIFQENEISVSILTKSDLVVRDIDIFKKMKQVEVGISLGCAKEEYVKMLEPGAVCVDRRVQALKKLKESNIKTYVMISPIIPYVSKLEPIFEKISPYVDYVIGEVLNVRKTNPNKLKVTLQKLMGIEKTKEILSLCSDVMYLEGVQKEFLRLCEKYEVSHHGFAVHNNKNAKRWINF